MNLNRISIRRDPDPDRIATGSNIHVFDGDGKEIHGISKVTFECEGGKAALVSLSFHMDLIDVDGLLHEVAILQHEHADKLPVVRTINRVG